jgi:hypothetical protein
MLRHLHLVILLVLGHNVYDMSHPHVQVKWYMIWGPILGLLAIDLLYQIGVTWKQSHILATAQPWFVVLGDY